MKHILRKLHIGGNHDGSRSHDVVGAPSSSATPSRSCATDHRTLSSWTNGAAPSNSASSGVSPRAGGEEEQANADYYTSEEEFQVQLALAISASNACNAVEDAESLQIKAAERLSLGRPPSLASDTNPIGEFLARRYWDYNVLDYGEKVMDGFYDVYCSLDDASSQGKMPSLLDLQRMAVSYNLAYEIVLVNRAIDPELEQLEHIVLSIALESGAAELGPLNSGLVQRIADLVAGHMGGPVSDANEMLTKWMITSCELRVSLNNIVLPLGRLQIGLSRHRALLFKVLADHVGIPCRLVKGSHYTGIDEGAVNIIKLDDEREFIVDLMATPGTLIPAENPSTVSAQNMEMDGLNSGQHVPEQPIQDFCSTVQDRDNWQPVGRGEGAGVCQYSMKDDSSDGYRCKDEIVNFEEPAGKAHCSNMNNVKPVENCVHKPTESAAAKSIPTLNGARRSPSCTEGAVLPAHQIKGKDVSQCVTNAAKENPNLEQKSQDSFWENSVADSSGLFADINPFQIIGEKKGVQQNRLSDRRNNDFQRRRENISSGPGRPPLPVLRKNPFICNDVAGEKSRMDFVEGMGQRRPLDSRAFNNPPVPIISASPSPHNCIAGISGGTGAHVSSFSSSAGAFALNGVHKGLTAAGSATAMAGLASSSRAVVATKCNEPPIEVPVGVTTDKFVPSCIENQMKAEVNNAFAQDLMVGEDPHGRGRIKEKKNYTKRERRQQMRERFVDSRGTSEEEQNPDNSNYGHHRRLDPVLDDVAEWEIPWEDLVIGERIGLGSYGEVYLADWNGTEVAVKKFLDQDFSGDALEEFRSEVRIMRRLRHPNVVLFMGAVTRPPNLSIVTEFLPRGSLYRLIHRPNIQIDEKRRIRMALDVAKGMNCLHSSTPTIVHRDLKSPNLLVDKNWAVKVCDFGLSRMKHNTFLSSKSTAGTPEWMAPEVLRNEPSNEKCDVYSFGVILWELATLRMPWSGMNPMQVVGAVGFQNRRLDIPKEVDPMVARIICECWQNDPSLRPSFSQLMAALKPLQRLVITPQPDIHSPISLQGHAVNARRET